MNPQQRLWYNQLLQYVSQLPKNYHFFLDKNFYVMALPNIPLNATDKRVIGKAFKLAVQNKIISVTFNYIFCNCPRCGYKDSANKIHYITI